MFTAIFLIAGVVLFTLEVLFGASVEVAIGVATLVSFAALGVGIDAWQRTRRIHRHKVTVRFTDGTQDVFETDDPFLLPPPKRPTPPDYYASRNRVP
jgi:hypothetical protein